MLPLSIAPLSQCGTAKVFRDPIVNFAYGGRADFRGRHNALYNFLSAPGLSVNVRRRRRSSSRITACSLSTARFSLRRT